MGIVQKAVKEQQALNLPWFATLREILNCYENQSEEVTTKHLCNEKPGKNIQVQLQRRFIELWETERLSNKKLYFYNHKRQFHGRKVPTADSEAKPGQSC